MVIVGDFLGATGVLSCCRGVSAEDVVEKFHLSEGTCVGFGLW